MRRPNRHVSPPAAMLGGNPGAASRSTDEPLRIIGGRFRGRKLRYSGDNRTRPMKDRVREAVFNLLGPAPQGKHVVDLFAGTGALALEAMSRGAVGATLIERHFPSAEVIRQNVTTLECQGQTDIISADTFYWAERDARLPNQTPWLVFCSPPYDLYVSRADDMQRLLTKLVEQAPAGSEFVVEADVRFDAGTLPDAAAWQTRAYPPAHVFLYAKPVVASTE